MSVITPAFVRIIVVWIVIVIQKRKLKLLYGSFLMYDINELDSFLMYYLEELDQRKSETNITILFNVKYLSLTVRILGAAPRLYRFFRSSLSS